jgi:glutaredoxin-like protein NrdH
LVELLSKPKCVGCTATKRKLTELGIDYVEYDMMEDPSALARAKELGHLSAPVVIVGDDSWSGYNPDKLLGLVESR